MDRNIFIRYFTGTLTKQEEKTLLDWIDKSESNREEFLRERKLWDMLLLNSPNADTVKSESMGEAKVRPFRSASGRWFSEFVKIAAVFIVAYGTGTWFTLKQSKSRGEAIFMNTVEVPVGQRTHLTLSDGTKVWLNSQTRFTFPNRFSRDNRTVQLDGEAMFDVVHNENAPFLVKTSTHQVKVLGTLFNVFAYKNSPVFETTLVRGKVVLTPNQSGALPTELHPSQQFVYNDRNHKTEVRKVETQEYMTWIEGVLTFNDQPFSSIVQRLERYYEVDIVVNYPELLDFRFTGKFRCTDPLPVILDVVKRYKSFRYTEGGNKIIIYK